MTLEIGSLAPSFEALDDEGNTLTLNDFKGKKVVLYFYPKDDTPGCTTEACSFRDNLSELKKLNVQVLGVSRDSAKSHQNFKNKYDLNFPLIVDQDEKICQAYDVIKEKTMYGRTSMGIERSTFLIDEEGKIQHIWRKVDVKDHTQDILEKLKS